jgi:general secretion pathway protein G
MRRIQEGLFIMTNRKAIKRGFTLIEILIVVVILGILAAIVIPQFTNAADEASASQAKTQLQSMRSQVQLFRAKVGRLPGDSDENGEMTADQCFTELETPGTIDGVVYAPFIPASPTLNGYTWGCTNGRLIVTEEPLW